MKFGIIDATSKALRIEDFSDIQAAQAKVGLRDVDHGTVRRERHGGIAIVVYKYSLFEPALAYFSIGKRLYAGNAVLYAFDSHGDSVDMPRPDFGITWYRDADAVEFAIQRGEVIRPTIGTDERVFWMWPAPKPDLRKIAAETSPKPGETAIFDGDTIISVSK